MSVRSTTIQYAARKSRSKRNKIDVLERKLKSLEDRIANQTDILPDTDNQVRLIKHELEGIVREKTQAAVIRCRANWAEYGEKPTRYFLNLEKRNAMKRSISKIKTCADITISESSEILKELEKFYSKLYTSGGTIDYSFLETIEIPCISEQSKQELDTCITIEELGKAVKMIENNKSPGVDGIPIEFYKCFWARIKEFMLSLYEEIIQDGEFHLTARRSITVLIEKIGKDPLLIKNWRPISLLNLDNKIYTKVLAERLQTVFPQIIHPMQTGFVKGRQLSDNIHKIMEVIDTCENQKIRALLVSYDFEKAFDTTEIEAIRAVLCHFGFGDFYQKMVDVIFNKPLSAVMNNGSWSNWYIPTRGTRQGCCLSPGIFNLVVETLGLAIRQDKDLEGILVNKHEIKAGQFADDLWTTLKATEENLRRMSNLLNRFKKFAGLKVNEEKCVALRIGSFKDSNAKFYSMRKLYWSPDVVKILGIYISPYGNIMYQRNFEDEIEKVDKIFKSWLHRKLTVLGKITVINTLVHSKFTHKFMAIKSPYPSFFKKIKEKVLNFIWEGKVHKISYTKLVHSYNRLGLKLIDLESKDKALKASWPVKWEKLRELGVENTWMFNQLPIKDASIWNCNIRSADIKTHFHTKNYLSPIPQIWEAWAMIKYKEIENFDELLMTKLVANSHIRRAGRPITAKWLVNSGIEYVLDIVHPTENRFLTYEEVKVQYPNAMEITKFYGILAAIPPVWKVWIRNTALTHVIDQDTSINLYVKDGGTKTFYWKIIEMRYPTPDSLVTIWNLELGTNFNHEQWWNLFPEFLEMIKPVKLRYFHYRYITKTLTTNVKRNKWNKEVSPLCSFCQDSPEIVSHLFFECKKSLESMGEITKVDQILSSNRGGIYS